MGRDVYLAVMKQRLRDLDSRIRTARDRLNASRNDTLTVELAGHLAMLEHRRASLRQKLDTLSSQPDCTWDDLRAEVETEWDTLVQDFEERVARLA